ncbi:hypothetical protein LCGC14_2415160 [marine sediment metagenome]|uniref:Uncharacterized protein n=1 Tax=marine sediment metagenome TaxID=412755 RepID=A0A0F9BRC1_9ZZZZ
MSLRWRKNGNLLCGAKHEALEGDTYIDDRLHYELSVELKVVIPRDDEHESGVWHWINEVFPVALR